MVSTVAAFQEWIAKTDKARHVYRGQADVEWRVVCSAVRRMQANPEVDPVRVGHALIAYTSDLLHGAARHLDTCTELPRRHSELDILAQLQHQGAATGLIDFTTRPLVALWFACSEHPAQDGAVYALSRAEAKDVDEIEARRRGAMPYFLYGANPDSRLHLWCPSWPMRGRPAAQSGVFVLGVPSILPPRLRRAVIAKQAKASLLEELRAQHGIMEESLFPDFAGFARANMASRPFDATRIGQFWVERAEQQRPVRSRAQDCIDCGLVYTEMGQHNQAVDWFTKAVDTAPDDVGAYVNRAGAKFRLGDFEGAREDYNAAVTRIEGTGNADARCARVYWDRAQVREELGDADACTDYNRALELGFKMWINPKTGKMTDNPEQYMDYLE